MVAQSVNITGLKRAQNCSGGALTCRAGRRHGWVYVSYGSKIPLDSQKPTRMPKKKLVFLASPSSRTSLTPLRVTRASGFERRQPRVTQHAGRDEGKP